MQQVWSSLNSLLVFNVRFVLSQLQSKYNTLLLRAKSKHSNSFCIHLIYIHWLTISIKICQVAKGINQECVQTTDMVDSICFSQEKRKKKREGSQVSTWIHENTCFFSPSVIHWGLTPHLVPISIALVALPRVKAQTHSCTKDRDLWLCDCQPLRSKPELTWWTGFALWGFQREDTSFSYQVQLFPYRI